MAMKPKLELRQGQSLVMTPQLQQAIKLLQMSNLELVEYVEKELEQNPLLESSDQSTQLTAPSKTDETQSNEEYDAPDVALELADNSVSAEAIGQMDGGWENTYGQDGKTDRAVQTERPTSQISNTGSSSGAGIGSSGEGYDIDAAPAEGRSMEDHMRGQLNISIINPVDNLIGTHLIGMLNEDGLMGGDIQHVADTLGADFADVENVLLQLQTFDPPGVFARNLSECLAIQLREKDRLDPLMATLLDNLDLLAKRDYAQIRKLCGIEEEEDLQQMIEDIQACNPRPGSIFGSLVVQSVAPDVYVREAADGSWHIELNSETLPKVLVNNQYHTTISRSAKSSEDQEFIAGCLAGANWLVKSLDQRAQTILKVSREIVRQQDGFLVHGVQHLRPLKLKTVADAIDMHESTISRVTSNKYMATPRGIVELKYFFTAAIASSGDGEDFSAEAVRQRIKTLIEDESPRKILSDDKIVDLLNSEGIDIARRTVAKYRESMRLGSSVQRRREKKAIA